MNIFKVIASSKKSFPEEIMSAIIAWLLNPNMEHGLGYEFLKRFVMLIEGQQGNISKKLRHRLRDLENNALNFGLELEYHVKSEKSEAFIDIVIFIDNYLIAIENKIYSGSASDKNQLIREYEGLKAMHGDKEIFIVFLVPSNGDLLDYSITQEFNELKHNVTKTIITWQKSNDYGSVSEMIENILQEEALGKIEPVAEYTRHTLKAFNAFLQNNFEGYDYEKEDRAKGINPNTEDRLGIQELSRKNEGFVGVQHGLAGLLRMDIEKIGYSKFQYTSVSMLNSRNWLNVKEFNNIVRWLTKGEELRFEFDAKLDVPTLYKIANYTNNSRLYIGIKGGLKALMGMSNDVIMQKKWEIKSLNENNNSQWINAELFRRALVEKGLWSVEFEVDNEYVNKVAIIINAVIEEFKERNSFIVMHTHPMDGFYNCISLFVNQGIKRVHLLDFNMGGNLHLFKNMTDEDLKESDPIAYLNADENEIAKIIISKLS